MNWNAKKPDCDLVHEDMRLRSISTVQDSLVTKDEVDAAISSGGGGGSGGGSSSGGSGSLGGSLKTAIDWSQGTWNSITEVENGLILKVAYNFSDFVTYKYNVGDEYPYDIDLHIKQYLFCPRLGNGLKSPFYNIFNTLYCPILNTPTNYEISGSIKVTPKEGGNLNISNTNLLIDSFLGRTSQGGTQGITQNYTLNLNFNLCRWEVRTFNDVQSYYNGADFWYFNINLTTGEVSLIPSQRQEELGYSLFWNPMRYSELVENPFSSIQIYPQVSNSERAISSLITSKFIQRNISPKDPYADLMGAGYTYDENDTGVVQEYKEMDICCRACDSPMEYDTNINGYEYKSVFPENVTNLTHDFVLNNINTIV